MSDRSTHFRITLAPPERLRELEAEALPELRDHFERIKHGLAAIAGVPDGAFYEAVTLRALALKPGILFGVLSTEQHAMKRGDVPPHVKELVAMAVARENEGERNPACAPYHAGAARFEGAHEDAIDAVARGAAGEALAPEVRGAVEFGRKAAFRPKEITDADFAALRAHGYGDGAILELVCTALITYLLSSLNPIFGLVEG